MKKLKLSKRKPEDMLYHNMDKMYIKQDNVLVHLHTGNYFEAELIGPKKGENVNSEESYPYIVVKVESTKQPVVFK